MKPVSSTCTGHVRVHFLGSGRLGVPVLDALIADPRIEFLGVTTQPARPAGRRRRLVTTPLGEHAVERGLCVETCANVNDAAFLEKIERRARTWGRQAGVEFGEALTTVSFPVLDDLPQRRWSS